MGLTVGLSLLVLGLLAIAYIIFKKRQQGAAHTRGPLQNVAYEGEPDTFYDHETTLQGVATRPGEYSELSLPLAPMT